MATYVLVHGGDRDGSIWNEVAACLRKEGHQVYCPSMASVKEVYLKHNIKEICDFIRHEQLDQIILVGHSYGAMVITGVADQLQDQIAYLVYVDSAIPENGQSLYGLLEHYGFDYRRLGLTPDPACIEPLHFDERKINQLPKAYIRCLRSEFIDALTPLYEKMVLQASLYHWIYFCLDTEHGCMFTQPHELAVILFGLQVFL